MAPYMRCDQELAGSMVLGSRADRYSSFKQGPSLEAALRPTHDGPGVNANALHHSPTDEEAFL